MRKSNFQSKVQNFHSQSAYSLYLLMNQLCCLHAVLQIKKFLLAIDKDMGSFVNQLDCKKSITLSLSSSILSPSIQL